MHTSFRPWFGKALTILIGAICAIGLGITAVHDGSAAVWRFGPWLLLLAGTVWAMYWQPVVEIHDTGVRLVNIVRTIDIPWQCLTEIDTVWSLTFITPTGRFAAWAAPAQSAVTSMRQSRRQQSALRRGVEAPRAEPVSERSANRRLPALTREIQQVWDDFRADGSSAGGTVAGGTAAGGTAAGGTAAAVSISWHSNVLFVGAGLLAMAILAAFTG